MSEWKGMITICDRCGAENRRSYTGRTEMDGGFTRINNFEALAEGWEMHDGKMFCPDCEREYQQTLKAFMGHIERKEEVAEYPTQEGFKFVKRTQDGLLIYKKEADGER